MGELVLASAALSLVAVAIEVAFVGLILARNPRGRTGRAYLVLMLCFIVWTSAEALVRLFPDAPRGDLWLWLRVQWTGQVLVPGTVLFFALSFPEVSRFLKHRGAILLVFSLSIALIVLTWTGDGLIHGIAATPLGPDAGTGPLYPYLFALFVAWLIVADVRLGRLAYLRRREPEGRAALVVFVGLAHTNALAILTDAMLPLFSGYVRSGLASAFVLDFAVFVAYAVYRYRFLILEPAAEVGRPAERGVPLREGSAQLILSTDKAPAYRGFRALVSRVPGLCVSATPPAILARRYLLDRTPIVWLTRVQDQPLAMKPSDLKFGGLQSLGRALHENPTTAILFDDVDYIALSIGFQETVALLKSLYDRCSRSGATLVVPLHPATFEPRQVALLGQIFDHTEYVHPQPSTVSDPSSILAVGSREWSWTQLPRDRDEKDALIVTHLHPSKYRALDGVPTADFLWLSESPEEGAVPPSGPEVGLARAVKRWMGAHPRSPVLLEGLEYLLAVNRLPEIVELVKGLVDVASLRGNRIVFCIRGEAVDVRTLTLLSVRCEATFVEKGEPFGVP